MKIYIPNTSKQSIGGGWTFLRNFKKGMPIMHTCVNTWQEADVILITGATITDRDEMIQAKAAGKKIVFRIDNMPKDSRNRGTAFSRMRDFARLSDYIIFQSEWAKEYVGSLLLSLDLWKTNRVIYNGVDTEYYYHSDDVNERLEVYLFVQYNRDENKRFPEAAYAFHLMHIKSKLLEKSVGKAMYPKLILIGRFSPEAEQYNHDFFAGEIISNWGVIDNPKEMGDAMRRCKHLLFPAFADASPNTVLEARACGLDILLVNSIGGTRELIGLKEIPTIQDMTNEYLEVFNNVLHNK